MGRGTKDNSHVFSSSNLEDGGTKNCQGKQEEEQAVEEVSIPLRRGHIVKLLHIQWSCQIGC